MLQPTPTFVNTWNGILFLIEVLSGLNWIKISLIVLTNIEIYKKKIIAKKQKINRQT